MADYRLEAHAIVSADGRISGADGAMPPGLVHETDQRRFQALLDEADLAVLGREGHERHPLKPGRRRLVLTSRIGGLEGADPVWFWNPAGAGTEAALSPALPKGGRVIVTGGARVFETLLDRLDAFDLAIAHDCAIPDGRACLPGAETLADLMARLREAGLMLRTAEWLDPAARIELRRFAR